MTHRDPIQSPVKILSIDSDGKAAPNIKGKKHLRRSAGAKYSVSIDTALKPSSSCPAWDLLS